MCGIVGGVRLDLAAVERAVATLRHRGPDAAGTWQSADGVVTLGHTRLAIVDLDPRSHQPFVSNRTGAVVTFNGEIYNFESVRRDLEREGVRFTTTSDTEVLVAAYEIWGDACLERLNGMFAFAIYDARRQRLFLARDRVGKKPLYYARCRDTFVFASSPTAIFTACPALPRTLADAALREYMELGFVSGSTSVFTHVSRLLPGCFATLDLGTGEWRTAPYWRLPRRRLEVASLDEAADALEPLLVDAVRIRLRADVPVAAFLSGGLDSSLVVAIARTLQPDIQSYTAAFAADEYDETSLAAYVAGALGVANTPLPIALPDRTLIERLSAHVDEPLADPSLLPSYVLSAAIRQHAKVALSGDGGDELFGGYPIYQQVLSRSRRSGGRTGRALAGLHRLLPVGIRGRNYLRHLGRADLELFRRLRGPVETVDVWPFAAAVSDRWVPRDPEEAWRDIDRRWRELDHTAEPTTLLQAMTEIDFLSYLPDDILVKMDRASMAVALEVRAPLLDYRVVEFAYALPDEFRLDGTTSKRVLKRLAERYLPTDYPWSRKRGFSVPEAEWFTGLLGPLLLDVAGRVPDHLYRVQIEAILARHRRNRREHQLLFKTLFLGLFLDTHQGGGASGSRVA